MQDNIILNRDGKEVEVFSFQVAHIISKPEESKNILKRCVIEVDEEYLKELLNYLEGKD